MVIVMVFAPIPLLISLIFPELLITTGKEAEGIGIGLAIFTALCSPFTAISIMRMGDYLEIHYKFWGYNTGRNPFGL